MKVVAILILLVQCAEALPGLNDDKYLDIIKQNIIDKEIQLNQLNDAFSFLSSILNDEKKNFLVSPFFKNRCAEIYSLVVNTEFKRVINDNLKKLGFYEYNELFSPKKTSVISAVDFILTRNFCMDLELNKDYLLLRKGVIVGNGFLQDMLKNKDDHNITISKIANDFNMKFGENKLNYINYLKTENSLNYVLKIASIANFKDIWENEFYNYSDYNFTYDNSKSVTAKFMQNIMEFVLADNSYGQAFRIFYKNRYYALDIILSHELPKNKNTLSIGYMIDLIIKLNKKQEKNNLTKSFIAIPEFEIKQFNNDITAYFKSSLLGSVNINKNINFINNSDPKISSIILQDINIKINKIGTNVEDTEANYDSLPLDISTIRNKDRIFINKPFIFMINELDYKKNIVNIKNIISLGKINNPNADK